MGTSYALEDEETSSEEVTAQEDDQTHGMTHQDNNDECPLASALVFSSLDTHFSPMVAVEQYIFHVFFPLTVPIAWCRYGMKHSLLQNYHWKMSFAWMSAYIPFLALASGLVCLFAEPDVLHIKHLILPFGVFFLQRLMIAVKYASLSPDEYR